ncbi:hypothetical protein AGMMS50268_32670 [Spirochaetia bacterium]|nr:hypothetical protein AGMMS49546_15600 [Spirochaetia bacterium]GHV92764.1 hypothetical protein AGMMS50268_32670 [Spirochaetia bacterium]
MSDTINPWQSPEAEISAERNSASSAFLTGSMVRYLKEASPWLRFIGILGFVGCGFMGVGGLVFAIIMAVFADLAGEFGGALGIFMGLGYILGGVLAFFPARFIYNFGAKIRNYTLSNAAPDLEEAFRNNKSFWKFYGVCSIVALAFIPVGLIATIVIAITSSFF